MVRFRWFFKVLVLSTSWGWVLSVAPAHPPGDGPPPGCAERLAAVDDDAYDAAYVVVLDHAINTVQISGVTHVDRHVLYKVLTEAGCGELAVLRWDYDPQSSHVEVREVNLWRNGTAIPVAVSGVKDLPAPQAAIYWGNRIKILALPRLNVGDGIEVVTFRKGYTYALLDGSGEGVSAPESNAPDDERFVPPMPGEYFDIVLFQEQVPLLEKRYELLLPPDKKLHFKVYNAPVYVDGGYDEDHLRYAWWAFDMAPVPDEPRQPDASDFVAKVVMATVESWEAKSRWFFEVNEGQFEFTPEIQQKVAEILSDLPSNASEADKAEALVHWVAQNIRYSGQTMGKGEGFTLHSGEMIFRQRSGVCKDIAGMLITMMRAAGMKANPAMTMAGSRIEEVPADQFNHCVTALLTDDGDYVMYDPTWVPYNNDIWSKLETEQQYLVGSVNGESLATIPYSAPEESPLHLLHEGQLDKAGTLKGHLRLDGSGAMDGRLRRLVYRTRKADLPSMVSGMLESISPGVRDVSFRYREPDDFSGDMWWEIDFTVPHFALALDGGLEFKSPAARLLKDQGVLFGGAAMAWPEKRESDLLLWHTQRLVVKERIELPRRMHLIQGEESEVVDETYAYFKAGSAVDGKVFTTQQRAEVRRRQIPPDGYAGFRRAMLEARKWMDMVFRLEGGDR